jgi:hypothetical protein
MTPFPQNLLMTKEKHRSFFIISEYNLHIPTDVTEKKRFVSKSFRQDTAEDFSEHSNNIKAEERL